MISFKMSRDQARMVEQQWLPYMIMFAESFVRSNAGKDAVYLNCKIVLSLLQDVQLIFKRKFLLASVPKKFTFSLSEAHASAFYVYLMKHPISPKQVWEYNFRQQLCDKLHKQLFANRPPAHESPPLSIEDFIEMMYD